MKKVLIFMMIAFIIAFTYCVQPSSEQQNAVSQPSPADQVARGKYLVSILDCNICHTPKVMSDRGPVMDTTKLLSGHPAAYVFDGIDTASIKSKGYTVVNSMFTAWAGPWGVSYTANLTPDETGIGNWQEENFFNAIRHGKSKGLANSRTLLPPMPWEAYSNLPDEDLKAIFAYLKSLPPVSNVVPNPLSPDKM